MTKELLHKACNKAMGAVLRFQYPETPCVPRPWINKMITLGEKYAASLGQNT